MKRGLYDIEVRPGSIQEVALLFHEVRERQRMYSEAALASGRAESPNETLERVRGYLLPGLERRQEEVQEQQAAFLRSLQDVNWTEVFELDPSIIEERQNEAAAVDALGPVAGSS